jgi:hypothetical protein
VNTSDCAGARLYVSFAEPRLLRLVEVMTVESSPGRVRSIEPGT